MDNSLEQKSDKVMINVCLFISWNFRGTHPHPALGEITDRRRTSEEEKADIPVGFNDPILLPKKTLRCRLFGREGSRLSLPVNVTEIT